MKPGPATSKRSKRLPSSCSFAVMASAIWRGAMWKARAPAIATLDAISPFLTSAGISTMKSGSLKFSYTLDSGAENFISLNLVDITVDKLPEA